MSEQLFNLKNIEKSLIQISSPIIYFEDFETDTLPFLKNIINRNNYIKDSISNNKKDVTSLSYLVDVKISQSDCIKLGIALEKVLEDIINSKTDLIDIKPKNSKGKKERDHLFKDEDKKIIYYSEIKSNLNLDTEKSKQTLTKCNSIKKELEKEYPEYKINVYLVCGRYYSNTKIHKNILQRYNDCKDSSEDQQGPGPERSSERAQEQRSCDNQRSSTDVKILGINEYFLNLGVDIEFNDENEYKIFINELANSLIKDN
jgi:hypothetical protein